MSASEPCFAAIAGDDDELAAEVAVRLGCSLPAECMPGVAANARILQRHADILHGVGE